MLFDFFFKPKWQSKNPRVRRQALSAMDPKRPESQTLFCEALRSDPDPVLRQWLVQQVADLGLLAEVAARDGDAMVRGQASQRWRKVVAGQDGGQFSLDERLQAIEAQNDLRLLEQVAKEGHEVPVRRAAMLRTNKDAVYGDVACLDLDADLRLEAAGYIQQRSTLERVLKVAKTKDKRVRALVQGRLDEQESGELRSPELYRCLRQLCVKLEAEMALLESRGDELRAAEQSRRLQAEWAQTHAAWQQAGHGRDEDQLAARFERARSALDDALVAAVRARAQAEAEGAALAAREQRLADACSQLEATAATVAAMPEPTAESTAMIQSALATAAQEWGRANSTEKSSELVQRYENAVAQAQSLGQRANLYLAGLQTLAELSTRSQGLLSHDEQHDIRAEVAGLVDKLDGLGSPDPWTWPPSQVQEVRGAVEALQARVAASTQAADSAREEFRKGVQDLLGLIESGQSKEAAEKARRLQLLLEGMSPETAQSLRRQRAYRNYQDARKKLRDLLDWQGWATTPLREQLCAELEQLAAEVEAHVGDAAYDFNAAARKVRDARGRWHKLGSAEGERTDELWERFNSVCNRAYAPCQVYFDQQASLRRGNAEAREALCGKLEAYFAEHVEGRPASDVDTRAIEKTLRDAQKQWTQIGPVARQEHSALLGRFRAAGDRLRAVVTEERERNRAIKEQLIKRAEQILAQLGTADSTQDSHAATGQVRGLRDEWKAVGAAAQERELWQRFRSACDQVFAKRQADFDFKAQALRANLAQRASFCQVLENLAGLEGEEIRAARPQVQQMEREWGTLGAVPKAESSAIEKRFRDAVLRFEERYAQAQVEERRAAREVLARKGSLCAAAEALADSLLRGGRADRGAWEDLKRQWAALPPSAGRQEQLLRERWDRAWERLDKLADPQSRQDAAADWVRTKAAQAQHKQRLCVRAEILAGIESPAEARDERLALQVSQLADKLGRRADGSSGRQGDEFDELLVQWYAAPVTEAETERALASRFARACAAAGHPRSGHAASVS